MPKLTKSVLDRTASKASPYFLWCSDISGFGVRVFPSGRKVFYADYYNVGGSRKRMSLGAYGTLTVDEARRMAKVTLADAIRGEDPALDRATRRKAVTVAELCSSYLEAAERGLIIGKGGHPKKSASI